MWGFSHWYIELLDFWSWRSTRRCNWSKFLKYFLLLGTTFLGHLGQILVPDLKGQLLLKRTSAHSFQGSDLLIFDGQRPHSKQHLLS